ncbi:MAG: hypothetical protein C4K60_06855 [Ideonella sp. MAG2]|nr:MAG: hypothetical protein C4K60_06855 [Ideonella sp. MAG2]
MAGNLISQTVQQAQQYFIYMNEPGNYSAWQSFWNLFFPVAADKPLSTGNNTWGSYQIKSVPKQINSANYFAWQQVNVPLSTGASCADGSEYKFFVNLTNASNNVLIFQEGGGGCFDYGDCSGHQPLKNPDGSWKLDAYGNVMETTAANVQNRNGIADDYMNVLANFGAGGELDGNSINLSNFTGPFMQRLALMDPHRLKVQDWNIVYMPYCTGDTHIGDNIKHLIRVDGRQGRVQHFNGVKNVTTALGWMRDHLPRPAQVFLTGQSAGSLGVDFHRLTVRKLLNPSDSLYTLPDAGFFSAEDPVGTNLEAFPSTLFIREAKASWWNYGLNITTPSSFANNLKTELPEFDPRNITNLSTLISKRNPQDRVLYLNAQADLNFPKYGYKNNPGFIEAAIANGDINKVEIPAHFSPMGNYLRKNWVHELQMKANTFADLSPHQGYFFPSGRMLAQSHMLTAFTYEGGINSDTGHTTINAIENLLDRRRPPVYRELESSPTLGLTLPLGPTNWALSTLVSTVNPELGAFMYGPPLNMKP